jgi:hypothetical protein
MRRRSSSEVPGNWFADVLSKGYASDDGAVVMVGDDEPLAFDVESLPHAPAPTTTVAAIVQMAARLRITPGQCSV